MAYDILSLFYQSNTDVIIQAEGIYYQNQV